ncbi:hypothetical protein [Escherichia phage SRT8]|uniref:Uncharacterized protein n=1 Tax=Escherichia phage SRT8 TaxID=2496545 RepID=A0A2D1GP71_9CAUD|nr:hypothetical protein FDI72_gp79 [Escherichia phage SRT8]ATN93856.1 hypothetical protein [Escherichia phage SRT8]
MTRINKHFFEMAQSSAREGVELTTYHAGNFDWDIAMKFLKMAYYRASVEEIESFIEDVKKVIHD